MYLYQVSKNLLEKQMLKIKTKINFGKAHQKTTVQQFVAARVHATQLQFHLVLLGSLKPREGTAATTAFYGGGTALRREGWCERWVAQPGSRLGRVGSQPALLNDLPALAGHHPASLAAWSPVPSVNTKTGGATVRWGSHHVLFQL